MREKRSYLFASVCSALGALVIFYKLLLNDLYLKFFHYPWIGFVVGALLLGNIGHGYFAFKSFRLVNKKSNIAEIVQVKISFYKSLIINFLIPYLFLIILFIVMKEYILSIFALLLFILMNSFCYQFDLKPILKLKKQS